MSWRSRLIEFQFCHFNFYEGRVSFIFRGFSSVRNKSIPSFQDGRVSFTFRGFSSAHCSSSSLRCMLLLSSSLLLLSWIFSVLLFSHWEGNASPSFEAISIPSIVDGRVAFAVRGFSQRELVLSSVLRLVQFRQSRRVRISRISWRQWFLFIVGVFSIP